MSERPENIQKVLWSLVLDSSAIVQIFLIFAGYSVPQDNQICGLYYNQKLILFRRNFPEQQRQVFICHHDNCWQNMTEAAFKILLATSWWNALFKQSRKVSVTDFLVNFSLNVPSAIRRTCVKFFCDDLMCGKGLHSPNPGHSLLSVKFNLNEFCSLINS